MLSSEIKTTENVLSRSRSSWTRAERKRSRSRRSMECFRCLLMTSVLACLSKLKRLLWRRVLRGICFIGPNDTLNQRMSDYIAFVEVNERDSLDAGNHVSRLDEARHFSKRKIDLRDVASDDSFAVVADPGQKHF